MKRVRALTPSGRSVGRSAMIASSCSLQNDDDDDGSAAASAAPLGNQVGVSSSLRTPRSRAEILAPSGRPRPRVAPFPSTCEQRPITKFDTLGSSFASVGPGCGQAAMTVCR